ncbi:hypothetical protein MKEN_01351500 [Mycena kentingensis (nom. inval.)]|nr:hypothetical protein MKEN_01351500 [Mycena kentingensis (nom. inval.)]
MFALSSKLLVLAALATLAVSSAIPADLAKSAPANLPRADIEKLAKETAPAENKVEPVLKNVKQRDVPLKDPQQEAGRVALDKTKPVNTVVEKVARDVLKAEQPVNAVVKNEKGNAPTALKKAQSLAKDAPAHEDLHRKPRAFPELSAASTQVNVAQRGLPVKLPVPRDLEQNAKNAPPSNDVVVQKPGAHDDQLVHEHEEKAPSQKADASMVPRSEDLVANDPVTKEQLIHENEQDM